MDNKEQEATKVIQERSGDTGEKGQDGYSPTAKVEQTSTGATITITDSTGTTTAIVTNGKDGYDDTELRTLIGTKADKTAIPTKTSQLTNDSNYVSDSEYVHTDNNYTAEEKSKLNSLEDYYGEVEGTSLEITDAGELPINSWELYGNTIQDSTEGYNLLNPTLATKTSNGITCTANGDGTYTLNGTATADITFTVGTDENLTVDTNYRFVGCPKNGSLTTYFMGWNFHGNEFGSGITSAKTSTTRNIQITVKSGITISNLVFKPMLTEDTTASYDDFEPYTGGIPSPNPDYPQDMESVEGYNEIHYPYKSTTSTISGVTFTDNGDGTITANGTATDAIAYILDSNNTDWSANFKKRVLNKSIYLSGCPSGGSTSTYRLQFWNYNANNGILSDTGTGGTGVFSNSSASYNLAIYVWKGATLNNVTFKPQITIGTTSKPYLPYKNIGIEVKNSDSSLSKIYSLPLQQPLRKIGDYADTFVKENGVWYEKHYIGEVVLDGSETITIYSQNTSRTIFRILNIIENAIKYDLTLSDPNLLSDHFISAPQYATWKTGDISRRMDTQNDLYLTYKADTTVSDFTTWLSSNPVTVNYILAEPTLLECTDEQVEVLENISKMETYKGMTYINTLATVEPTLDIEYYKDLASNYQIQQLFKTLYNAMS